MNSIRAIRITARGRLTLPVQIRRVLGILGTEATLIAEPVGNAVKLTPAEIKKRQPLRLRPEFQKLVEEARRSGSVSLTLDQLNDMAPDTDLVGSGT